MYLCKLHRLSKQLTFPFDFIHNFCYHGLMYCVLFSYSHNLLEYARLIDCDFSVK